MDDVSATRSLNYSVGRETERGGRGWAEGGTTFEAQRPGGPAEAAMRKGGGNDALQSGGANGPLIASNIFNNSSQKNHTEPQSKRGHDTEV